MDNASNVLARYQLINSALKGAKQIPVSLLQACNSQGAFANLHLAEAGIFPIALNTLKANADKFIEDGGWKRLDEMRIAYRTQIRNLPSKHSHANSLKAKLASVEHALEIERRYRIRLQVAYEELLGHLKASQDPNLSHIINRHIAAFSLKRLAAV